MNGTGKTSVPVAGYAAFGDDYRADPTLRARAEADPRGVLAERGWGIPPAVDVRIVANTDEMFHLVLPPDPNTLLADEALHAVAGGDTFGSVGSASTASTIPSTVSCAGTVGTLGSSRL